MASLLNEESVEKKLKTVNNTQDSIQSLSLWIIHHKSNHSKIVQLWMKVLKRTVHPSHRLTLFYLCNDVVQTCKKKKAPIYTATFKEHLKEAAGLVRDLTVKNKIERIFKIWQERNVYDASFISSLLLVLNGKAVKPKNEKMINKHLLAKPSNRKSDGKVPKEKNKGKEKEDANGPISPAGSPYIPTPKAETPETQPVVENTVEHDAEESARILAEFKPHEMIEQITMFQRHEGEILLKVKQLSHLKLDASSLEAVKQLKDRAHGNEFSSLFEDSCTKLEDLVKCQTEHLADQKTLLDILTTSETFYEAQYREARIVANAYKNFGARINNMKKKLDEQKKTMPRPVSPDPSPDINAPSPGSTPPHLGRTPYDYTPSDSHMAFSPVGPPSGWMLNGNASFDGNSMAIENTFQDSPPLEAPSPEVSPPGLNLGAADTGGTSLDSRLASLMDRGHRNMETTPSVYTPHMPRSFSTHSAKVSNRLVEDDGSTTPLDDEAPTTPVQDEPSSSPPKRITTPPKKENPIDFLSRLISQSHKGPTPTTKSGAASLLDSFTMLSSAVKPFSQSTADSDRRDTTSQSWPITSQPSSPTSSFQSIIGIPSQPASLSFSRPPPTMVPAPIPLPVPPPPMAPLNPPPLPPSMNLTVPPPPPPPFSIVPPLPTFPIRATPGFQQTSPGQKENWPESGLSAELPGTNRLTSTHSSVLKELTSAKGFSVSASSNPSPEVTSLIDPEAMDIVSDDDAESMDTNNEGTSEFASKLKQKTMGLANVKSHIFVPNMERPNLVTLSVSEDLDEDDMIDDDTMMEQQSSDWPSSKLHKSKKSRSPSRSRSRSKERSHRHKKKKKHKRKDGDEEDNKMLPHDEDDDNVRNVGSIVKRLDSRSSSRNSRDSLKGDKYEDRGKYSDNYEDRKYDRHDDRKYRNDNKPSYSQRDPRSRDIEAYTQAFIQQYSQARYGTYGSGGGGGGGGLSSSNPQRRSSYGKY